MNGWGWSSFTGLSLATRSPLFAHTAWSLTPGAEFFLLSTYGYNGIVAAVMPLLIAREQRSGLWLLLVGYPTGDTFIGIAWNPRAQRTVRLWGLRGNDGAPSSASRFRVLTRALPLPSTARPCQARCYDSCLLPAELRTGGPGIGGWVNLPDGSGWLGVGGSLMLRLRDGQGAR